MTSLTLIAAMDCRRAIGRGNALPWHFPDDLKHFKELTVNKPVLMGRRTAESLGRALPRRKNLVLTRSGSVPFDAMHACATLAQAIAAADAPELMVIGGSEIYALTLPLATRMHLTMINTVVEGADVFFPEFNTGDWRITARQNRCADSQHPFDFEFVDWERVSGNQV